MDIIRSWFRKTGILGKTLFVGGIVFLLVFACLAVVGMVDLYTFLTGSEPQEQEKPTAAQTEEAIVEEILQAEEEVVQAEPTQDIPQTLSEKVDLLQMLGVLGEMETDFTLDETNPNALVELLIKQGKIIQVDFSNLTTEPPECYHQLFGLLNTTEGEILDLEVLELEIADYEDEWGPYQAILARLKQGDNEYTGQLHYSDYTPVDKYYYRLVNRMLADAGNDYRIFSATIFCEDENCDSNVFVGGNPVIKDQLGLILLTENQAETIYQSRIFPICCREFEIVTTTEIERMLDEYQDLGLFNGMDEEELQRKQAEILRNQLDSLDDIVYYFDNLFFNFDLETGNFENPYQEITLELVELSKGEFGPTDIIDNYDYNTNSEFSFTLNSTRYQIELENYGDWLDFSFMGLFNRALQEQGSEGQFYSLETGDQTATIIFLTREQYERIQSKQLMAIQPIGDSNE